MKYFLLSTMFFFNLICLAQVDVVGGGCDGCEIMYIDMPEIVSSTSYSPAWNDEGQKLLITGQVLANDGVTPASDVIIYYWQTDNKGYYSSKANQSKDTKRHGYIRGWVKSDNNGNYSIYTIKPKAYPNRNSPAHIHLSIKEPSIEDEYYVDNLAFDYDPLLTTEKRKKLQNRGGSGILRALLSGDMIIAEHNIILGLNIPNYPQSESMPELQLTYGLQIGEDFPSITPHHAWGADKGTNTCPVCRYGRYFGIMYFVNEINSQEVKDWLLFLEELGKKQDGFLKVYLIYGSKEDFDFSIDKKQLTQLGKELDLKHIALTFVPSFQDKKSDVYLTKINPENKNTLIIYKNRNIIGKLINVEAKSKNFNAISLMLKENQSHYFNLPIDTSR